MAVRAIRGAVQVDANEREAILEGTTELVAEVMARNTLDPDDVIGGVFTGPPGPTAEVRPWRPEDRLPGRAPAVRHGDRGTTPCPRSAAADAHRDRQAALGHAARLPARRGRAAAGHRTVRSAP